MMQFSSSPLSLAQLQNKMFSQDQISSNNKPSRNAQFQIILQNQHVYLTQKFTKSNIVVDLTKINVSQNQSQTLQKAERLQFIKQLIEKSNIQMKEESKRIANQLKSNCSQLLAEAFNTDAFNLPEHYQLGNKKYSLTIDNFEKWLRRNYFVEEKNLSVFESFVWIVKKYTKRSLKDPKEAQRVVKKMEELSRGPNGFEALSNKYNLISRRTKDINSINPSDHLNHQEWSYLKLMDQDSLMKYMEKYKSEQNRLCIVLGEMEPQCSICSDLLCNYLLSMLTEDTRKSFNSLNMSLMKLKQDIKILHLDEGWELSTFNDMCGQSKYIKEPKYTHQAKLSGSTLSKTRQHSNGFDFQESLKTHQLVKTKSDPREQRQKGKIRKASDQIHQAAYQQKSIQNVDEMLQNIKILSVNSRLNKLFERNEKNQKDRMCKDIQFHEECLIEYLKDSEFQAQ